MHRLLILLLLVVLVGCGAPRFDGSSQKAAEASIEAMSAGMSEEESQQLAASVVTILFTENLARAFSGQKPTDAEIYASLDGLTAAEIIAKAEQIRAHANQHHPGAATE